MPWKYTDEQKQNIYNKLLKYVHKVDNPILAKFCYQNDLPKQTLSDWGTRTDRETIDDDLVQCDFAGLIKKALAKAEVYYQELAESKPNLMTWCIFWQKCHAQWLESRADQPTQEIHIHNHERETVKKLDEAELSTLIQQDLLKPPKPPKSKRN